MTAIEGTAETERAAQDPAEVSLLVFKACVVALWSDGRMAAAERDHLSHLIDTVASSEAERTEMRRLALHDVNRHVVLGEVERLDEAARRDVFDRCVDLLVSDRRLGRREVRFLAELRRHCGVGFLAFERVVWRSLWRRRVAALLVVAAVAAVAAIVPSLRQQPSGPPPLELAERQEVSLRALTAPAGELPSDELYQAVRGSVVTVNVLRGGALQGNGSGAVIGWDRFGQLYVLTNRHVVLQLLPEGERLDFEVELENGVKLPALLDFYSRRWDLALLLIPGLAGWAEPLPVVPRQQLRVGQHVYAVGSPIGLRHTFTSGVISALRGDFIQTDATVYLGSSGGPLIDGRGAVCGIVTQTHSAKDFSFAIYADTILDLLEERRIPAGGGEVED